MIPKRALIALGAAVLLAGLPALAQGASYTTPTYGTGAPGVNGYNIPGAFGYNSPGTVGYSPVPGTFGYPQRVEPRVAAVCPAHGFDHAVRGSHG